MVFSFPTVIIIAIYKIHAQSFYSVIKHKCNCKKRERERVNKTNICAKYSYGAKERMWMP